MTLQVRRGGVALSLRLHQLAVEEEGAIILHQALAVLGVVALNPTAPVVRVRQGRVTRGVPAPKLTTVAVVEEGPGSRAEPMGLGMEEMAFLRLLPAPLQLGLVGVVQLLAAPVAEVLVVLATPHPVKKILAEGVVVVPRRVVSVSPVVKASSLFVI